MWKNIFRDIRATAGRFVAIFAITALGAGFFAGLKATSPDMKNTADAYYRESQLMDLRLLSTLGFTEADIAALRAQAGVEAVMPVWGMDLLVQHPEGDEAARFNALPQNTGAENDDYLNRVVLVEGGMPQRADECLVDSASAYRVGDTLALSTGNDADALDLMLEKRFTVVGRIESPLYVAFMRGNTNIGNGRISYFVYLLPQAFDREVYTDVYLRLAGSGQLSSFAPAYDTLVDEAAEQLETLGAERADIRYEEVLAEGQEKLADARAELADAQAEVADGEQELADGRRELADGRREADAQLAEAWQKILDGEAELADGRREVAENEQKLADAEGQIEAGVQALAAARAALEDAQREYDDGKAELDRQRAAWEKGRDQYQKGLAEYEAGAAQLGALQQAVDGIAAAAAGLEALLPQVAAGQAESVALFEQTAREAAAGLEQLAAGLDAGGLDGGAGLLLAAQGVQAALAAGEYGQAWGTLAAVPPGLQPGLDAAGAELDAAKAELDAAKAELDTGESALNEATETLRAAKREMADGWAQVDAGEADLARARGEVESGYAQLAEAKQTLADAQVTLAEGKAEYEREKAKAEQELADAEKELSDGEAELADAREQLAEAEDEIADAQRQLDELEAPEWFVRTRDDNPGYSGFASDTDRIDAIAVVIPVFFFLVSALVCLTTMTRMVEEQRGMIGTLKSLGYNRRSIAVKYVGYAALASTAGAVAGVLLGYAAFPRAIWEAYTIMYIMPALRPAGNYVLTAVSILVSVLCTTLATLAACMGELRSVPAQLLRQKAPRAGRRVFLERIGPLWRRMSFMAKVTARNLMRYKKRFFMTVVGVAGCTALLLTGFGLRDSITGIVGRQYGGIDLYDIMVALPEPSDARADTGLNDLLPQLGDGLYIQQQLVDAESDGESNAGMTTYIFVAQDAERLTQFVHFADRKTGAAVAFPDGERVVVTEKLADRLRLKAGDTMEISRANEKPVTVQVGGIIENYIFNYIYMTPAHYTALFGQAPEYDTVLLTLADDGAMTGEAAVSALLEADGVAGAVEIDAMKDQFDDMFAGLNAVVWLIIAAAGMLAFVVLYNLTNINITERAREIATLKVLGFYNGEVAAYVYRENLLLTVIGMAAGLVLGVFLHDFVITTAEIDEVMFRRVIEPLSYLWSVVFTLASAGLVNLVMLPRLRNVNMVESLKAAE